MNTPCVTIILPTYKRDWECLFRALSSLQCQTYQNIEIVVVDDSPEDYKYREEIKTRMNQLCIEDTRIVYIVNEKNLGGSLARNKGIEVAKGEYITFLDDDDEYLPEKVAHQVEFMIEENCDLCFENMIMYNSSGKVVDVREYADLTDFNNENLLTYHLMKHLTGTPTFMFKTESLRKIEGFSDVKMGQEFLLMLRAIEKDLCIRYYPICDVRIYKHSDGGISQGKNKINGENNLYEFKKRYFNKLTTAQQRFIKFRHCAVMVVAHIRNRMYLHAVGFAIKAFFVAPLVFFKCVFEFFAKLLKTRSET